MKRILSLIAVTVITCVSLAYALWDVDLDKLGRLLANGSYRMLAPFLGLLVLFYWMKALRWTWLLRPIGRFRVPQVTPAMIIGFAANNLLPAHLGELVRIAVFAHRYAKPVSSITVTLLVERVFDVIAILSLYAIGMAVLDSPPPSLQIGSDLLGVLLAGGCAVLAVVLYRPALVLAAGRRLGMLLPGRVGQRLNGMLENMIHAFSSLRSPALVVAMTLWSLLKWVMMAGMVWVSVYAYGLAISPAVCLILMAVLALAAAVPNAPGYIGAMQAAYVFVLKPFGIPEETAFAASVLFLVAQWVPVTTAGAYFFISGGLHLGEVRREIEEVEHAQDAEPV